MCWAHDPSNAEERRRNASKGGKRGGNGRPGASAELQEIRDLLKKLTDDVLDGSRQRSDAVVANQLLNTRLRLVEFERKTQDLDDILDRLEALEDGLPAGLFKQSRG